MPPPPPPPTVRQPLPRGIEQRGVDGEVHDLQHVQVRAQQLPGQGQVGHLVHAHRGGVYRARGVGDVGRGHGASRAVLAVELSGQRLGSRRVHVVETQFLHAHGQRRVRDGRARAAGTQQHAREVGIGQLALEVPGSAPAVGVVADELAVAVHHGVDRPHGARLVGELVQQRDDGLLAGEGDAQPGKADGAYGGEQRGAGLGGVQVYELLVPAQAVVARFLFLHRRRERMLNACANQAEKQLALRNVHRDGRRHECCRDGVDVARAAAAALVENSLLAGIVGGRARVVIRLTWATPPSSLQQAARCRGRCRLPCSTCPRQAWTCHGSWPVQQRGPR